MCLIGTLTVSLTSITAVETDAADTAVASNAEPTENSYQIVTPVPLGSSIEDITQPARLDGESALQGATIALVGGSFSASVTHAVFKELLEKEYGCKTYFMEEIGKSGTYNPLNPSAKSKEFQQKLKDYGVDAVISGNCGCGICTVKETGNAIAAEYIGIPAVVIAAETFVPQVQSTGYNRGVPVIRTVAYPGAFANDETAKQQSKANQLFDELVTALTTQISQAEIDAIAGAAASVKYDDVIFTGSYQRVQEFYEVNEMSDGLPVVPPTKDKIEYYLQFTNKAADYIVNSKNDGSVIGVKPAYKNIMTYQVAVNAIMSGCPAESDIYGGAISMNASQTQSYYWYTATVEISKDVNTEFLFKNKYSMNAKTTVTASGDKTYYFAVDNLNFGTKVEDLTDVDVYIRNFVKSASNMISNDVYAAGVATTSIDGQIYKMGDVNSDDDISIFDASAIQLALVQKNELSETSAALADYDLDSDITIFDATQIQLYLVNNG